MTSILRGPLSLHSSSQLWNSSNSNSNSFRPQNYPFQREFICSVENIFHRKIFSIVFDGKYFPPFLMENIFHHFSVGNNLQKGRCELLKFGHFRLIFSTSTRLLEYHNKSQLDVLILTKCKSSIKSFIKLNCQSAIII